MIAWSNTVVVKHSTVDQKVPNSNLTVASQVVFLYPSSPWETMKGQEVKIKPLPFLPLLFHFDPGCVNTSTVDTYVTNPCTWFCTQAGHLLA